MAHEVFKILVLEKAIVMHLQLLEWIFALVKKEKVGATIYQRDCSKIQAHNSGQACWTL